MAFDLDGGVSEDLWHVEVVPNDDLLYCHVHRTWRRKSGEIAPSAFVGRLSSLSMYEFSTDWSR